MSISDISAITLATRNMAAAVAFYEKCGFCVTFGGVDADFTSLLSGDAYVNLLNQPGYAFKWWGRVIFRVHDVDAVYQRCLDAGLETLTSPADAEWGERFFHIADPDGHELSFAQLL